ncbi:hypothetical protein [Kordiimonas sp. SCSIO 12610]|uniref:hypothetical protein n=1 Tax=Kordiimonas sp. SCSIO 12610 TaxID=2829597 RepID=UPI00210DE7ED|nr:hypothetical protein [Kordiimonas sp. SCSIO 12610]UTW54264.1 hypothetical protein KFF44_10575 [Kordiimonas sp. SCSIO 12610]
MTPIDNSSKPTLSDTIKSQIITNRPLLIVDADEVLLQFVKALENFIETKGFYIFFESFQLSGNIRRRSDDTPIDQAMTSQLIGEFFENDVEKVEEVDGASDALRHLSNYYQIFILSNVPQKVETRRRQHLKNLGIDYPLIANKGGKGLVAKEMSLAANSKTVFIDDLPPQHSSVAEYADHIHRLHMIADQRLAKLIGKAESAHVRIDDWDKATAYLIDHINA